MGRSADRLRDGFGRRADAAGAGAYVVCQSAVSVWAADSAFQRAAVQDFWRQCMGILLRGADGCGADDGADLSDCAAVHWAIGIDCGGNCVSILLRVCASDAEWEFQFCIFVSIVCAVWRAAGAGEHLFSHQACEEARKEKRETRN